MGDVQLSKISNVTVLRSKNLISENIRKPSLVFNVYMIEIQDR